MATSVTCAQIEKGGVDYALGWLKPGRRAAFDLHLASCPNPHPAFESDLRVSAQLLSLAVPEPSPAVHDRILAAIRAEAAKPRG